MNNATTTININNKKVTFEQQGKQVFCTSLDIARVFEKNHYDILRIIKDFEKDEDMRDFTKRNFAVCAYKGVARPEGRNYRYYKVSRDGFSFVAMGLTGKEARKWKISFINAFNFMENELKTIRDNATATLERPKEVFNLIYETPCRDAILKVVRDSEVQHNAKAKGIKEYTITEKMKRGKVYTNCQVGIEWDKYIPPTKPISKLRKAR